MAGPLDPFNPGEDNSPFAGVDPQAFTRVRQEWDSFLGNPQGRAALLSAGLSLMQPPSFGDTATSQIGRAIGAGGETASRNEAMDLKKSEAESKDELRQVRGQAALSNAESRAAAAEARVGAAGARAETAAERLKAMQEGGRMRAAIALSQQYQGYTRSVAERNRKGAEGLLGMQGKFTPEPILSYPDWVAANPQLKNMGFDVKTPAADPDDETTVPAAADTTSKPAARSPQDAQALEWANANPTDPRAVAIKKRLGVP